MKIAFRESFRKDIEAIIDRWLPVNDGVGKRLGALDLQSAWIDLLLFYLSSI